MKKKVLYILLFYLVFIISCKQKNNFDFNQIVKIHHKINFKNKDSVLFYIQEAKKTLQKHKNIPDSLIAQHNLFLARYYRNVKKIDSAIIYYKKAIKHPLIETYLELADLYLDNEDYLNSLSTLNELETNINHLDNYHLAQINIQKQEAYKLLKNYEKALFYNTKAIDFLKKDKDTIQLINNLLYRANIDYYYIHRKEIAYKILDSISTIDFEQSEHKKLLNNQIYQTYGIFKYYDGDFNSAAKNYLKALDYIRNPKIKIDSFHLANTFANISEVFMDMNKYNISKKYLDSVDQLSVVLDNNLQNFHLQNKLRWSYETKKPFSEISKKLAVINEVMNQKYEKRIVKELNTLKEANKKEKELLKANQKKTIHVEQLKRKQMMLFSILALLLFLAFLSYLFYRQKQLKAEKEEIFMQQRLFRAQMNPHFTSNVLYNIKDLVNENKEKAIKYIVTFSRLLRLNLENSMQNYTLIDNEIEVLSKYLDLQQLRFPDKFKYQIETNNIETDLLSIPPMLIQPFVENTIEHAFKNIEYKGLIRINLIEKNEFIFCEIIDNGIGLQNKNTKENHHSASTTLIKALIFKMTKKKVVIKNNNKTKGVKVSFYIPFKSYL